MTTIYIKNVSELLLPRCIKREGRGLNDLAPGEMGELGLPDSAPIIKNWLEKGRIKFLTEAEYKAAKVVTSVAQPVAAAKAVTLEDGSAAINPGYDSIPEAEEIPEPVVSNIDKTGKVIALQAPPDTKVVAPVKGDPIVVTDFAPKILTDDGRVIDTAPKPAPVQAQELAGTLAPQAMKPVETEVVAPEAQATPVAPEVRAEEIASMKAWRQQDKALRTGAVAGTVTAEVLALVKAKTKFDIISKLCDELTTKKSS